MPRTGRPKGSVFDEIRPEIEECLAKQMNPVQIYFTLDLGERGYNLDSLDGYIDRTLRDYRIQSGAKVTDNGRICRKSMFDKYHDDIETLARKGYGYKKIFTLLELNPSYYKRGSLYSYIKNNF